jgi:molybdenum cofactor cytidylyltransferase
MIPVSAIIPAAGNSGRMGTDKAFLLHPDGSTFSRFLVNCYSSFGASPVIVVVNTEMDQSQLNCNDAVCVVNQNISMGRSWSIRLGLQQVPADHSCFIQNIDNPFAEHALFETLLSQLEKDRYVVPVINGKGGHPVLIGSNIADHMRGLGTFNDIRDILKSYKRTEVPVKDERILWNINTPAAYSQFMKTAGR